MTMTEILLDARAKGLTYGKYVQMYHPTFSQETKRPRVGAGNGSQRICAGCGREIVGAWHNQKYCSARCRDRAAHKAYYQRKKRKKETGKPCK